MVVEELGSATHVLFTVEAPPVDVDSVRAATDDGERATLIATDRRALFTAEVEEEANVRPGDRLGLAVDPARLHFFDPETGVSLRAAAVAVGRRRLAAGAGQETVNGESTTGGPRFFAVRSPNPGRTTQR